jgi:hypothetical protein
MTLHQLRILDSQLELCRALIWHKQNQERPAMLHQVAGKYRSNMATAMKRLVRDGNVTKLQVENIESDGSRTAYEITPAGEKWYAQMQLIYKSLLKQSTITGSINGKS